MGVFPVICCFFASELVSLFVWSPQHKPVGASCKLQDTINFAARRVSVKGDVGCIGGELRGTDSSGTEDI